MRKQPSSTIARTTLGALSLLSAIFLLCVIPLVRTHAQNPSSGTVGPSPGGPSAAWDQTIITPGGGVNTEAACVDGTTCEVFTLTVGGSGSGWAGQRVQVQLTWQSSGNEYDIYIHKGGVNGPLVTSAASGPGLTSQTAFINPTTDGLGTYTIHIVPDTTPVVTDHYHGTATAVPLTPAPPPPAPQDTGPKIGYENFTAPGVLVPVTTTSAGQQVHSVEYMGRNAGEPSVGSNWGTGVANIQSDLQTLFVTFDDSCPNTGQSSIWVDRAAPTSIVIDSDPIGFTDRGFTDALGLHSRVFAAELTLLSPDTVKISYTDDDGLTWIPTQSGGLASAVDHETLGGGIYHAPIPARPPGTTYPNAIYYCSQDIAAALCSRSDDGGLTYGPSVAIYNLTACGGLHGHVKVSPVDGTVYVPNRACGAQSAVVVSQDNGVTWAVRPVQNGSVSDTAASDDPAVGIDSNGRVYFLFADNGTAAGVATSDDFGATWQNILDVGAVYGLKQIAFPAAVGGSATPGNPNSGRAAVAFYGSTTATGDSNAANFTGVWHLYVAETFDGGAHWTTTDVTPNAPMQRSGLLRGGGADITRNLLDFFDITIDRDGRVLVGYVNGCEGGNCAQAAPTATGNAYTTTATIARQSSGRRLLASKDPASSTSQPGMPSATQRRIGSTVHLAWSEADTGNSPITGYQILRGPSSGAETLLTTVAGTQTGGTFDDLTATDITKTYYYEVRATNGVGTSCGNNEVAAPYLGNACTGITIHQNDPTHPEANAGTNTPASLLIDYIAVGEPADKPGMFLFKMKVNDLSTVPPNSRWRITWNSFSSPGQQYYVGMTTGNTGAPTFEYGTLADAGVPAIFVIEETTVGTADPASNFQSDGTIKIYVPKSAFGNPQPGDLLGAVGGRTLTGDNSNCATDLPPCTPNNKLERSNGFVDHTFVKAQSDNSFPAATYTVAGNAACEGGIVPLSAVSRKTHDSISPAFDINLPLSGNLGIECRVGQGTNSNNHQVVVTFPGPITLVGTPTVSSGTGSVSTATTSGNQAFINLTGVTNAQRIAITLVVNDGANTGPVVVPMGVLLGDVDATGRVDGNDVSAVQSHTRQTTDATNYRYDVDVSGRIDGNDVSTTQAHTRTSLP
jgi:Fibronectin type III domain